MTHALISALEAAANNWAGSQPNGPMLTATRAFLESAGRDSTLLAEAAASLTRLSAGPATWLAVACGTAVERGASPEITGPAVFDLLRATLSGLPEWNESSSDELPELTSEQTATLELLPFLCQSVVTHLARLPAQRESMGADAVLLNRLNQISAYSHGAIWVREALTKSSGALLLLHPSARKGLRLRYSNVSNCFHLFSLVQTAVGTSLEGGNEPNAVIARVARGKSSEEVSDQAWWHYSHASSAVPEIATSIRGDGLVREIPEIDGFRVVLAWPPILATRHWDAGFLGPHLDAMPADVVLEGALTDAECIAWLERLGSGKRKPWWRRG
jgi:hypothetical protein